MKSYLSTLSFLTFAIGALLPSAGMAQVTVGNTNDNNTYTVTTAAALGQDFNTPDIYDSLLNSVSVNLTPYTGNTTDTVDFSIAQIQGATVGSALFTSVITVSGSDAVYTINTGSLSLNPLDTYAFILGVDPSVPNGTQAFRVDDAIFDASGAITVNGGMDNPAGPFGLTYQATFSPVPEASTYAIGGLVLCLGLVLYHHRKRRQAPALTATAA